MLGCIGCGAPESGRAQTETLCGQAGPIRILEVGPESLVSAGPARVGDRIVLATMSPDQQTSPAPASEAWSVDGCGGDPVLLTSSLYYNLIIAPPWPEALIARRKLGPDEHELIALDPKGTAPPRVLASGLSQHSSIIVGTDGLLIVPAEGDRLEPGDLVFHPYAEQDEPGLEPSVTLLRGRARDVTILDGEVFFVPQDGPLASSLVRISLEDLRSTVEATEVSRYVATSSHLLMTLTDELRLRDRETGALQSFSLISDDPEIGLDDETATIYFNHDSWLNQASGSPQTMLIDLESGASHEFRGLHLGERAPDGRWLVIGEHVAGIVGLADPRSGEIEVLSENIPKQLDFEPASDGLLVSESWPEKGLVGLLPYSDGDPELLALRSSYSFRRLNDGRVLTIVYNEEDPSELVVVDRGSLNERLVDTHVRMLWSRGIGADADTDVFAYQVSEGERSGIYLVNLGDLPIP